MSHQHLLVTDIDGTLLRDGEATPGLKLIKRLVKAHESAVALVYATGRSIDSTLDLVEQGILPSPKAIAPFVGTELWFPDWHHSSEYENEISAQWNAQEILFWAERVFRLRRQEARFQSDHKLSFYLDNHSKLYDFETFLASKNLKAKVVYSCGKYLDIIPIRAGKANAVKFLSQLWNIPPSNILTCGDSGNDIDMLTDPNTCNVAVGNLEQELKRLAGTGRFYVAELPYAAGVLEGAVAFDFWPKCASSSADPFERTAS